MEGSLPCSLSAAGIKGQLTSSYGNSLRPAQKSGASHHMAPEGEDLFLLTLVWGLSAQVTYSVQRRPLPRGQSMTLSWETLSTCRRLTLRPFSTSSVLGPHRWASDTLRSPGFGIPGDRWAAQNVGFSQPISVNCQFYIQFEVKTVFHACINCSWPAHRQLHITSEGQAIIWGSLKPYWEHVHFSQLRYKSYRHSSARKWQLHIPKKNT